MLLSQFFGNQVRRLIIATSIATAFVTISTSITAASAWANDSFDNHSWSFANGAKLVFEFGLTEEKVTFYSADGTKQWEAPGPIHSMPSNDGRPKTKMLLINTVPTAKLICFQVGSTLVLASQNGAYATKFIFARTERLPQVSGIFSRPFLKYSTRRIERDHDGTEALLLSFDNGIESATIKVNENMMESFVDGRGHDFVAEASNAPEPVPVPVAAPTQPKSDALAAIQKEWKFANGNALRFIFSGEKGKDQILFDNGKGPVVLKSGDVGIYPAIFAENASGIQGIHQETSGVALLQLDGKIVAITQNGEFHDLPIDQAKLMSPSGVIETAKALTHNGRSYVVLSAQHRPQTSDPAFIGAPGDTLVIRDDGAVVRFDFQFHEFKEIGYRLEDGILTVPGVIRQIDLDRFDMEAAVKILPLRKVEKQDTKQGSDEKFQDPFDVMDAFKNLAKELRYEKLPSEDLDSGKETEEAIERGLGKIERTSVVVLGDAGSGKTETARTMLAKIIQGKTRIPRTWLMYELSATAIGSGGRYRGDTEAKINAMLAASEAVPIIWFANELHTLKGQGTASNSPVDVLEWIKNGLDRGVMRILATSTDYDFNQNLGLDPAFAERFTKVTHNAPYGTKLIGVLKRWIAKQGRPIPKDDVLEKAVRLSTEFNAVGGQPRKTVSLLEEIYSDLQIRGESRRAPELADVLSSAQRLYQADPALFDRGNMRAKIEGLRGELDARVAGQGQIKERLIQRTRNAYTGAADSLRPAISMLLGGPRGVGKTELAKAYAEAMGLPILIIEMNQYANGKSPAEFLNEIRDAMAKNAYTVLLFDEIEKAHPLVQNALLELLNSGECTAPAWNGRRAAKVSIRKAAAIMTTNAGKDLIAAAMSASATNSKRMGFKAATEETSTLETTKVMLSLTAFREAVIRDGISDLVVDRVLDVLPALYPTPKEFADVVAIHLKRALRELSASNEAKIALANPEEFIVTAVRAFYRPDMSNRVVHTIIDQLRTGIADALWKLPDGTLKRGEAITFAFGPEGFTLSREYCAGLLNGEGGGN